MSGTERKYTSGAAGSRVSRALALSRLSWFTGAAVILSVIVPILAVYTTDDVGRSSAWILTCIIMVWSGTHLALIVAAGKPQLFAFIFWLFCYIFFGLAPTVQVRTGLVSSTTKDMPSSVDGAVALVVIGSLVAFEVGSRVRLRLATNTAPAQTRRLSPLWSYALMAVGLLFMVYYVQSIGLGALFQTREARQLARSTSFPDQSAASIVSALAWVPLLISGGSLIMQRATASPRQRSVMLLFGVASIASVLIVVNPISGARYTAGTVLFAVICYTGVLQRERLVRVLLSGLIVGFLFVFPIADAFRRAASSTDRSAFFTEYELNGDYDSFWQIGNALLYIEQNDPTWGKQVLGVLLFWIPRSIWPGKAEDSGVLLATFRNYEFTNLSAPLWAEALLNGGLFFLLATFLILGLVVRRLDDAIPDALRSQTALSVAACIFPAYFIILLRGSLLQAMGIFAVMLLSLFLISRGRVHNKRRR